MTRNPKHPIILASEKHNIRNVFRAFGAVCKAMKRLFDPKNYEKLVDDRYRHYLQMKLACVLLGCTALVMSVLNAFAGTWQLAAVTAGFFLICVVNLLLLRHDKHLTVVNLLLFEVPVFIVCTYFLQTGGAEGFSPYWILIVPCCITTLLGRKRGTVLVAAVWLMTLFLLWTGIGRGMLQYDYGKVFCQRFPVVYLVCALTGYGFETSRYLALKQMQSAQEKLRILSETDKLTGLRNRAWFQEKLDGVYGKNRTAQKSEALLLMDIDGFKIINDTWGHKNGDKVLVEIAKRLSGAFCEEESLCRWGGEEFLAYLPHCTAQEAKEKAEKICQLVRSEPVESMDGQMIHVTISVGVVVLPDGISLKESEAFIEADKQLYTAKRNGRDRVSMKIEQ